MGTYTMLCGTTYQVNDGLTGQARRDFGYHHLVHCRLPECKAARERPFEKAWLFEAGDPDVWHLAKAGAQAVYGIGRQPSRPDRSLRETYCGVFPTFWAGISLVLSHEDYAPKPCQECCKVAGIVVPGQQVLGC